jgi:outer membrane protein OmpA-like peptidoglycan-associated protein
VAVPFYRHHARIMGPVARWFFPALLLTVGVHVGIYHYLHRTRFEWFSPAQFKREVPRAFKVARVEIDPKLLDQDIAKKPASKPSTKPAPDITDIQIPGEAKPSFEKMMQQAETVIAAPVSEKTMVQEKPKVEEINALDRTLADNNPAQLPSDLKALTDQLLNGKPVVTGSHPSFDVNGPENSSRPNAGPNVGMPNFSNLDSLLSSKGPLTSKTAPILLPTDLLFDYGSPDLRPAAVGSLQKLAELIQRNPNASFIIEGHTDNFGSPVYNAGLSLARAESVKVWLVTSAGINAGRIQTRGLGMTRLLVPNGTVDEQQLNRRVEIVIRNNRGAR